LSTSITINGQDFTPLPGVTYRYDYVAAALDIEKVREEQGDHAADELSRGVFRDMFLNDLFFVLYFVIKNKAANHPFVVAACKEVEDGPKTMTLDIWAREHFKSSIITTAETLQDHGRDKDESTCIMSATRTLAKKILRALMDIMEGEAVFLNFIFPHVVDSKGKVKLWGPFWEDPTRQAPLWSANDGLKLRRDSNAHTPSLYAAGLEEGMPTGDHYGKLLFDDITNADVAKSPQRMNDLKDLFDVAQDIGTLNGRSRVVGTFYHWADPLVYVRDKKKINSDEPLYHTRIKPATHDGSANGIPVLLSQEKLDEKKTQRTFNTQQLCNPVPAETRKLSSSMLKEIDPKNIPVNTIKLMGVDPAGLREDGKGDNWAMAVVGVDPNADDLGASNFYILDLFIDRLDEKDAPYTCAQMYLRGGMIQMMGVEKVGQSTAEVHIANALKPHGRILSREARNLMFLKPAKREKAGRIEKGWSYLLANGKIHISTKIDPAYRNKLAEELDSFPYASNDDGSDILAYIFKDMMQDYDVRALMSTFAPQEHVELRGDRKIPLSQRRTGGTSWASR
jgi:hypothetical protein